METSTPQQSNSPSGVQSYREMMETMRKFQTTLYKLQDKAVELQLKFADANFASATLFDPVVSAILTESSEMSSRRDDPSSQGESNEQKSKQLDLAHENMCQEVLEHVTQNPSTTSNS